jgi:hypothetical protein
MKDENGRMKETCETCEMCETCDEKAPSSLGRDEGADAPHAGGRMVVNRPRLSPAPAADGSRWSKRRSA